VGELEFVGHMNPRRLTSLAEDFKKEQAEFLNDEAKRKDRRANIEPVLEVTYERLLDLNNESPL
jgi:hypothetical protein